MTKELKDLLLKYLSMALPYGVKVLNTAEGSNEICELDSILTSRKNKNNVFVGLTLPDDALMTGIEMVKPYLRSMSSMTEKEMEEYNGEFEKDRQDILKVGKEFEEMYKNKEYESVWQHPVVPMYRHIIWLLKNHFDFMDLIPQGIAIEVTKDNNPY